MKSILRYSVLFWILFCSINADRVPNRGKFDFEWADCGLSDRRLRIEKIDVLPQPLVLYGRTLLNISADINLLEDMNDDITVSIKIWRHQNLVFNTIKLPIPCLDGFLGSCKLGFCKYFYDPRANPIFCSILNKIGKKCECPISADRFTADHVTGTLALDALPIPAALLRLGTVSHPLSSSQVLKF